MVLTGKQDYQAVNLAFLAGHAAGRENVGELVDALEFIGQNAPSEAMRNNWLVGSLIRVIEVDAERANEALARWKASAR